MSGRRAKTFHQAFGIPARETPGAGSAGRTGGSVEIVVRVATMDRTPFRIVPADSVCVLVLLHPAATHAAEVRLPDGGQTEVLRHAGDAFFLPPRSLVLPSPAAQENILQYVAPRAALRLFCERTAQAGKDKLETPRLTADPFLLALSRAVRALLQEGAACTPGFREMFAATFYRYVTKRYGTGGDGGEHFAGGLSPQHKRTLDEVLAHAPGAAVSLEMVAERCGLSSRHFARAFRQSFGVSFYRHMVRLRMEKAKRLLLETDQPLREIAIECGYADQATFTESFTAAVGDPPGRYRRRYGSGARYAANGYRGGESQGIRAVVAEP